MGIRESKTARKGRRICGWKRALPPALVRVALVGLGATILLNREAAFVGERRRSAKKKKNFLHLADRMYVCTYVCERIDQQSTEGNRP